MNSPFGVISEVVHEESFSSHIIPVPKPRNDIQSSIDSNQSLQHLDHTNHSQSTLLKPIQQDSNNHQSQSTINQSTQQNNNNNHPKPTQQTNQQQHTSQVHLPPPPPPPSITNNTTEQVSANTNQQQQTTPIIQNTLLQPLPSYIGTDSNPTNVSQDHEIDDTIHVFSLFLF